MSGFVLPSLVKKSDSNSILGETGVTIASHREMSPPQSPSNVTEEVVSRIDNICLPNPSPAASVTQTKVSHSDEPIDNAGVTPSAPKRATKGHFISETEKDLLIQSFFDLQNPDESDDDSPKGDDPPPHPEVLSAIPNRAVGVQSSVTDFARSTASFMDSFEIIDDLTSLPDVKRYPQLSEDAWNAMFDPEGIT